MQNLNLVLLFKRQNLKTNLNYFSFKKKTLRLGKKFEKMQRNSNLNKILINRFVIFVFCFIILTYYVFVFQFMFSLMDKYPGTSDFLLVIFHFSFIMMFWSLLTAMFTEPGKVPLYWVIKKNFHTFIKNNFRASF